MTTHDLERLMALRAELFTAIKEALARDGHCKSYEGTFAILMPNYFEHTGQNAYGSSEEWVIKLDCYVIGPSRHYHWSGETFTAALEKAEVNIRQWIAEDKAEAE